MKTVSRSCQQSGYSEESEPVSSGSTLPGRSQKSSGRVPGNPRHPITVTLDVRHWLVTTETTDTHHQRWSDTHQVPPTPPSPLQVPQLHRPISSTGSQADVWLVKRNAGLWAEDDGANVCAVSFGQSESRETGRKLELVIFTLWGNLNI